MENKEPEYKVPIIEDSIISKDLFECDISILYPKKEGKSYIYSVGEQHYWTDYGDEIYYDIMELCRTKSIKLDDAKFTIITETKIEPTTMRGTREEASRLKSFIQRKDVRSYACDYRYYIIELFCDDKFQFWLVALAADIIEEKNSYVKDMYKLYNNDNNVTNAALLELFKVREHWPSENEVDIEEIKSFLYQFRMYYFANLLLISCIYYNKTIEGLFNTDEEGYEYFHKKVKFIKDILYNKLDNTYDNNSYDKDLKNIKDTLNFLNEKNINTKDRELYNRFKKDFNDAKEFYNDKRSILDDNINNYKDLIHYNKVDNYNADEIIMYDIFSIMHAYKAALIPNNITIIVSGSVHSANYKKTLCSIKGINLLTDLKVKRTFKQHFINVGLLDPCLTNLGNLLNHLNSYYDYMSKLLNQNINRHDMILDMSNYKNTEELYKELPDVIDIPNKIRYILVMLKIFGSNRPKNEKKYIYNLLCKFNFDVNPLSYKSYSVYTNKEINIEESTAKSFLEYLFGVKSDVINNIINNICDIHKQLHLEQPPPIDNTASYAFINLITCPKCNVYMNINILENLDEKIYKIGNKIPTYKDREEKIKNIKIQIALPSLSNINTILEKEENNHILESINKIDVDYNLMHLYSSPDYNIIDSVIIQILDNIQNNIQSNIQNNIQNDILVNSKKLSDDDFLKTTVKKYVYGLLLIDKCKVIGDVANIYMNLIYTGYYIDINHDNLIISYYNLEKFGRSGDIDTYVDDDIGSFKNKINNLINAQLFNENGVFNIYSINRPANPNEKKQLAKLIISDERKAKEYMAHIIYSDDNYINTYRFTHDDGFVDIDALYKSIYNSTGLPECITMGGNSNILSIITFFLIFIIIYLIYSICVLMYKKIKYYHKKNLAIT